MKATKRHRNPREIRSQVSGFTLVELLVVITIIIVLAALSMVGVNRMRFSAAQVVTMNQMRQIGVAALTWGSEKNQGEPPYAANGTGDHPDESIPGVNPALAPGNPAIMFFNKDEPDQGYITDHRMFYSPLVKTTVPARKDYKPKEATVGKTWGTYVWRYPFSNSMTSRQTAAAKLWFGGIRVKPSLDNKLVMMTDYSKSKPVWKNLELALLVDGTIRVLAQDETPIPLPK